MRKELIAVLAGGLVVVLSACAPEKAPVPPAEFLQS